MIDAVMKVLQTEREKEKVQEQEDDGDKIGDGIRATAADQDVAMVDNAGPATGFSLPGGRCTHDLGAQCDRGVRLCPCDVYNGVLDLPSTREWHTNAMKNLNYSDLATFSKSRALSEASHHIVALPCTPSHCYATSTVG